MTPGHGYQAKYDYVDLIVENRGDHWSLTLRDTRHGESVESDEQFETASEARSAAITLAQNHINVQHNDTLLAQRMLNWQEF